MAYVWYAIGYVATDSVVIFKMYAFGGREFFFYGVDQLVETFDGFSTFKIMESPKRTAEVSEDTELTTLTDEQLSGGETVS